MNKIEKFSELWHLVGTQLRDEMYKSKYDLINTLTMIDLSILSEIEKSPKIIFKELSNTLNIPKSTLTSAIKRLEKQHYVKRNQSLKDGRQFELTLTDKGEIAQSQHIKTESIVFSKLLNGLEESDQKHFVELFEIALKKEY